MKCEKNELTIYEVEGFHTELEKEFQAGAVSIDLASVNKIDMSVLQLLIATQKSCLSASKSFSLNNINDEVLSTINSAACGFLLGKNND